MNEGFDNTQANEEGWCLQQTGIKRSIPYIVRSYTRHFYTDKEAKDHVQAKAAEGSAYHIDALARTQLL